MANVSITWRIMPSEADIDLTKIENQISETVSKFTGNNNIKFTVEPIAFGLKALKVMFVMDENKNLEELEDSVKVMENIASVEAIDVRRMLG